MACAVCTRLLQAVGLCWKYWQRQVWGRSRSTFFVMFFPDLLISYKYKHLTLKKKSQLFRASSHACLSLQRHFLFLLCSGHSYLFSDPWTTTSCCYGFIYPVPSTQYAILLLWIFYLPDLAFTDTWRPSSNICPLFESPPAPQLPPLKQMWALPLLHHHWTLYIFINNNENYHFLATMCQTCICKHFTCINLHTQNHLKS